MRAGHLGAVEALLAAGADPTGTLHVAVHRGAAMVAALVAAGADIEEPQPWSFLHSAGGATPLHVAARSPEVATVLLAAGADVNARERTYNCTPLHFATKATAAEVLLGAGADVNARCHDGDTPLHTFFWSRYLVADILQLASPPHDAPLPAADVIEVLIAAGADLNARNDRLETPLHHAAGNRGRPDVVLRLLAAGAEVDATDDRGRTPLYWAADETTIRRSSRRCWRPGRTLRPEQMAAGHRCSKPPGPSRLRSYKRSWRLAPMWRQRTVSAARPCT